MKTITPNRNTWLVRLLCLYVIAVLLRFALALLSTSFPTVTIDEFLYSSLARSIATEGRLLYRGQSADYSYLVYPLVLSPVYIFCKTGMHIYRIIQFWDIMLMNLSVFPIFLLGREVLKSEKKAFLFTLLSLLLPDFILGELILSEVILYPLFFSLMYCVYVYISKNEKNCLLYTGLLGGLMYSTKPGAVVPAAVFLILVFIRSVIRKNRKELLWAAESMLIFFITAAFFWALARFAFGFEGGFLSIYKAQFDGSQITEANIWSFKTFLSELVITAFYLILACGIVGFVYPLAVLPKFAPENRSFYWFIIISLAVMILGTVWAVEQAPGLFNIQLRYIAMYIPLMLLFCCIPLHEIGRCREPAPKTLPPVRICVLLGFIVLCCLIFGCKANDQMSTYPAQLSVSLFNDLVFTKSRAFWGNAAIIALCAIVFVVLYCGCKCESFRRFCMLFMVGFMMINTILGYTPAIHSYAFNREAEKAGLGVHKLTRGKPYLQLQSIERIADYGVDVNTKQNNMIVTTNGFLNCLQQNDGLYVPYIPELKRGMNSVIETPETDTLVMFNDIYPLLKFSKSTTVLSPNDLGNVYVVHFNPGERLVDSAVSNLANRTLYVGYSGIIHLFSEEYLQNPLKIRMEIESDIAQTMTINTPNELHTVELSVGRAWYETSFERAAIGFNFQTEEDQIRFFSYELEPLTDPAD